MNRFLAGAGCLALLVLVVMPFASDARKNPTPRLSFATVNGPDIQIPPSAPTTSARTSFAAGAAGRRLASGC
jgi:hypothetical protein